MCRQERPVCKSFAGRVPNTARQKCWPGAGRWSKKDLHFTTHRCRQCHYGLDVLGILDFVISAATTIIVQCHLHVTVHWNSSTHTKWQNKCSNVNGTCLKDKERSLGHVLEKTFWSYLDKKSSFWSWKFQDFASNYYSIFWEQWTNYGQIIIML